MKRYLFLNLSVLIYDFKYVMHTLRKAALNPGPTRKNLREGMLPICTPIGIQIASTGVRHEEFEVIFHIDWPTRPFLGGCPTLNFPRCRDGPE